MYSLRRKQQETSCWSLGLLLEEIQKNGIEGVLPSGQDPTQLILKSVKKKRHTELAVPKEQQQIKTYANVIQRMGWAPSQQVQQNLAASPCGSGLRMKKELGVEGLCKLPLRWKKVVGAKGWVLQGDAERPVHEAGKSEIWRYWRWEEVGGIRVTEHLPRKTANRTWSQPKREVMDSQQNWKEWETWRGHLRPLMTGIELFLSLPC